MGENNEAKEIVMVKLVKKKKSNGQFFLDIWPLQTKLPHTKRIQVPPHTQKQQNKNQNVPTKEICIFSDCLSYCKNKKLLKLKLFYLILAEHNVAYQSNKNS